MRKKELEKEVRELKFALYKLAHSFEMFLDKMGYKKGGAEHR
jgi:hypothetical protein